MRKITATLIAFLILVGQATPAFGWGDKGHRTVGQIAQLHLADTNTLTRIRQILRPNETLASISTWADRVKNENDFDPQATHPDPDTQDFFRRMANRRNRDWHFVDLPLNCASYDACPDFTSSSDIVHIIRLCIRKLRGGNVPRLTKRNALRMLTHLVGDLHQPLHVGVGFINVEGPDNAIVIAKDPQEILDNEFPNDRGGNDLLISGEQSSNLHSFWDTALVNLAIGNRSISAYGRHLKDTITPQPDWDGQGSFNNWAAQWASDSLLVSRSNAYDDAITIEREVIVDDRPKYIVTLVDNYRDNNRPIAERQLAKGGYRLAKLLRAILP